LAGHGAIKRALAAENNAGLCLNSSLSRAIIPGFRLGARFSVKDSNSLGK
jgi:hypothetical protein